MKSFPKYWSLPLKYSQPSLLIKEVVSVPLLFVRTSQSEIKFTFFLLFVGCRLRAEALLSASQDPKDEGGEEVSVSLKLLRHLFALLCLVLFCFVFWHFLIAHAGWRHDLDAAAEVHPGRDGQSVDGEESVQGATDGAAGGRSVDRNDQVWTEGCYYVKGPILLLLCPFSDLFSVFFSSETC